MNFLSFKLSPSTLKVSVFLSMGLLLTACPFSSRDRRVVQTCKPGQKKVNGVCMTPEGDDLSKGKKGGFNTPYYGNGDDPKFGDEETEEELLARLEAERRKREREKEEEEEDDDDDDDSVGGADHDRREPFPIGQDEDDEDSLGESRDSGVLGEIAQDERRWRRQTTKKKLAIGLWLSKEKGENKPLVAILDFPENRRPDLKEVSYVYPEKHFEPEDLKMNAEGLIKSPLSLDVKVVLKIDDNGTPLTCVSDKLTLSGKHLYVVKEDNTRLNKPLESEIECK